jgi:hypothetical protein
MSNNARPPAPSTLPVAETARDVLRTVRSVAGSVARAALGPFTVIFLVEGALGLLGQPVAVLEVLAFAVVILATTMYLVDVHRIVLLGPQAAANLPRFRPNARDGRYLGNGVLVALIVALVLLVPVILLAPGFVAIPGGPLILAVVVSLLGLAGMLAIGQKLPATAVDRDISIGAAWDSTKRRLTALLGLVLLLLAPLHLLATAAATLYAGASMGGFPVIPPLLLSLAAQFTELTLFAALLSVIYRRCSGVNLTV